MGIVGMEDRAVEYVPFIEHNDWEGETWKFWIPVEGNEDAIEALREHIANDDEAIESFEMPEVDPLDDDDVDSLVDHGGEGYMRNHHKLEGTLDTDTLLELEGDELCDVFNKGGIRNYVD